jgi:hypothetical protein
VPIIIGIVLILTSVWTVLPVEFFGLGWGPIVVGFLQGAGPILGILIGLVAFFIGIADMKDKAEAAREEAAEKKEAEGE